MHEFAVTQSIVDVALETAQQHQARGLKEIHLSIGNLTGIVEDSLQFYFEALSRGSLAEGARLVVHPQCAVATCRDCGYSTPVEPPFSAYCLRCNGPHVSVSGGDALIVERVELVME